MVEISSTEAVIRPLDRHWISFVESVPNSMVFHHPAWINLIANTYGYRPFVITIEDDKGEIMAGIPIMEVNSRLTGRRWISLPFTDHCQPLYYGDSPPKELFEYLSELQIKGYEPRRLEIRSAIPVNGLGHEDNRQVLHLLRLSPDVDGIYQDFHKSQVKRNIAKAEREGVIIKWAESKHDLDIFYNLQVKTRHRLGVPVQPKRYFDLLWDSIIKDGLGFILLAYKNSKPIAGGVFLTFKNTVVYKYGASDSNFWQFRPNHKLFWTAIEWGCENGYEVFDWGKTDVNDRGLRQFKDGWGALETTLTYSILSAADPEQSISKLTNKIKPLIRRLPRWVCRLSGELLYGHFA